MLTMQTREARLKNVLLMVPWPWIMRYPRMRPGEGIDSEVAGHADILVVPDLDAGNMFTKSLTFFAGLKTAGTVNGTKIPVIMCSRTDSTDDKYHTVLAALMQLICD